MKDDMKMAACIRGYHSDTVQDTQHVLFPLTLASSLHGNKNSMYWAPTVCQHNSKLGFKKSLFRNFEIYEWESSSRVQTNF